MSPNAKLEMQKFWLRPWLSWLPVSQRLTNSQSLFFSNSHPTRRPPSRPHPTGYFVPVSHSPWLQTSSNRPLLVSHSPSLPSPSPFPFPPDPEHSWRDKSKNPKLCFFLCLMVCCESMFMFWVFYNLLLGIGGRDGEWCC